MLDVATSAFRCCCCKGSLPAPMRRGTVSVCGGGDTAPSSGASSFMWVVGGSDEEVEDCETSDGGEWPEEGIEFMEYTCLQLFENGDLWLISMHVINNLATIFYLFTIKTSHFEFTSLSSMKNQWYLAISGQGVGAFKKLQIFSKILCFHSYK